MDVKVKKHVCLFTFWHFFGFVIRFLPCKQKHVQFFYILQRKIHWPQKSKGSVSAKPGFINAEPRPKNLAKFAIWGWASTKNDQRPGVQLLGLGHQTDVLNAISRNCLMSNPKNTYVCVCFDTNVFHCDGFYRLKCIPLAWLPAIFFVFFDIFEFVTRLLPFNHIHVNGFAV